MKYPIEWHRECLENSIRTLATQVQERDNLQRNIERARDDIAFYSFQIDLAKERGLEGFDRDKLGIKRKKETL